MPHSDPVHRGDVEAGVVARVDAERTDADERAGIRRILDREGVAARIDVVERRRRGIGDAVRVRRAYDARRRGGTGVTGAVGKNAVDEGDRTGVGMSAQVLVRMRGDADSIDRRVEVEAERGADEGGCERSRANRNDRAAGDVDAVEAARAREGEQLLVQRPLIEPDDLLAGREAGEGSAGDRVGVSLEKLTRRFCVSTP